MAPICLEKRPVMLEQRLLHRPQARAVRGSDRALHWEGLCLTGGGRSQQRTGLGAGPVNREICREFAQASTARACFGALACGQIKGLRAAGDFPETRNSEISGNRGRRRLQHLGYHLFGRRRDV